MLRQLLDERPVRPPYGGHPRIFIWGLLEARLQQADLMILGGMNEGVWPSLPAPDPWLAPKIRANLGLAGLEFRTGLAAHDFASALGAPRVLVTRARRDAKAPTVASRFWLRLMAMTGGLARDLRLERLAAAIDDPGEHKPAERPAPSPPIEDRPKIISVTALDRLKADPFAFYAQAMLQLRLLDPVDADHTRGMERHGGPSRARTMACRRPLRSGPAAPACPETACGRGDPPDAPRLVAAAPDRGDRLDCGA